MKPDSIIAGRKAIITKAIFQPVAKAIIIPALPILIFVNKEVIFVTRA